MVASKTAFLAALLSGMSGASALLREKHYYEARFFEWMSEHSKSYETGQEFVERLENWALADDLIQTHNSEGGHTYILGHNAYSDMSPLEFRKHFKLGEFARHMPAFGVKGEKVDISNVTVPDAIDWVEKKMVSEVKNQGQCGSCWAFSTTGSLESAYAIKNQKLVEFSEQQLVDCDKVDEGCNGGLMDNAFQFIKKNNGLCTESDYKYTARDGRCQTSCSNVEGSTVQSFVDVDKTEEALLAAVAQQPVSVAIEADQASFQFYAGGVFTGKCGNKLDHGVLAVGFGEEDGNKFWKVKNSWGDSWGDNGYIKLVRGIKPNKGGQCGILLGASYPTL